MKGIGVFTAIALVVVLGACGGGTLIINPANGAWSESLSSTTGQQLGSFTFTMTQHDTGLTGCCMNFANMDSLAPCFNTGTLISGHMGQGMMNGGTMTMTMSWTDPDNTGTNTLTMQGNMAMDMHSGLGNFTLTGQSPGCTSQQGTFTMTHM